MRALRTHHDDEAEFVRRVDEVQRPEGYRIVGAFEGGRCVAVAGFRELHTWRGGTSSTWTTFRRTPTAARRGHARALLEWCAEEARRLGCDAAAPRLGRGGQPPRRPSPLPQHRHANHQLPLRESHRCAAGRAGGFRRAASVIEAAERVALVAERELEALVGVSTPSGDEAGAEEAVALCVAFLPPEAQVERVRCSTARHARRPGRPPARDGSKAGAAASATSTRSWPTPTHRPLTRAGTACSDRARST